MLSVLLICLLLGAYSFHLHVITPAVQRAGCMNQMRQIALGMHNFESAYKHFPQAVTTGSDGKPWHSWRTRVLPFLDTSHHDYTYDQPWNHQKNQHYLAFLPEDFRCESVHKNSTGHKHVNYVVVIGEGTMFPPNRTVKFDDIKDGASNTILLVESLNTGINLTEPKDLDIATMSFKINDSNMPSISSHHSGGVNVVFADGSATTISDKIKPAELRALLTIAGSEDVSRQNLVERGILGG